MWQKRTGSKEYGEGVTDCDSRQSEHRPRLLIVREIVSTHVATEVLPFDRVPPSIAIPDYAFVKRQNASGIGWYYCHDIKPSSRSCT